MSIPLEFDPALMAPPRLGAVDGVGVGEVLGMGLKFENFNTMRLLPDSRRTYSLSASGGGVVGVVLGVQALELLPIVI